MNGVVLAAALTARFGAVPDISCTVTTSQPTLVEQSVTPTNFLDVQAVWTNEFWSVRLHPVPNKPGWGVRSVVCRSPSTARNSSSNTVTTIKPGNVVMWATLTNADGLETMTLVMYQSHATRKPAFLGWKPGSFAENVTTNVEARIRGKTAAARAASIYSGDFLRPAKFKFRWNPDFYLHDLVDKTAFPVAKWYPDLIWPSGPVKASQNGTNVTSTAPFFFYTNMAPVISFDSDEGVLSVTSIIDSNHITVSTSNVVASTSFVWSVMQNATWYQTGGGELISPIHAMMAGHMSQPHDHQGCYRFYDTNGVGHDRRFIDTIRYSSAGRFSFTNQWNTNWWTWDLAVALLAGEPAPGTPVYKMMPWWQKGQLLLTNYAPVACSGAFPVARLPLISLNQDHFFCLVNRAGPHNLYPDWSKDVNGNEIPRGGDSGHPSFWLVDNKLVLHESLETWEVNTLSNTMHELSRTNGRPYYSPQFEDLARFPTW